MTVHNIPNLSCQEQKHLVNIGFDRYFYHLQTKRWERHILKHSFTKQFCPWPTKLILPLNTDTSVAKFPTLKICWKSFSSFDFPFLNFRLNFNKIAKQKSILCFCWTIWIKKSNQKSNEKKSVPQSHAWEGRRGEWWKETRSQSFEIQITLLLWNKRLLF